MAAAWVPNLHEHASRTIMRVHPEHQYAREARTPSQLATMLQVIYTALTQYGVHA